MKQKKLVVIADIHSNYIALKSALDIVDTINPEGIIFLGDYVSDCPYPQRTMKMLYEYKSKYKCWFIRGNREDYQLAHRENPNDGWCYSSATGSLLYTYENLTVADLDFFASMPECCDIRLDGCPVITACHGSPSATRAWIKGKPELLDKYTRNINGELLLCGHTHKAEVNSINHKTVIFCPSVGLPQDGENSMRLTVLTCENGQWTYEMLTFDFHSDSMINEIYKSGLADKGKLWMLCMIRELRENKSFAVPCISLALKKANEDGYVERPISEKYWTEAAREIGIL